MKKRRVKFIWGASRVIRGRWFFGLLGMYDREAGHREDGLAISVRGLVIWLGAFAAVLYVAATLALFWIWQRNPYSVLSYEDALLYPIRRSHLDEKKGQGLIAQGQDLSRENKWHEAANLLRLGLARYPRDFRARLTLSRYHLMMLQRPLALQVLQDGLGDEYPGRTYLDGLFKIAMDGDEQELVARVGRRYLPRLRREGPAADYRWLMGRTIAALLAAGQPAEALTLAESDGTGDAAWEHRVLALLALGRPAEAVTVLGEWRAQPGANVATVVRLQVRAFRETKRFQEMDQTLAELRVLIPADPVPLIYAVVQQAMAGRDAKAVAAYDDFIFRFGGAEANLVQLANPLAEIGQLDLLQRCAAAAAERGYSRPRFQVLAIPLLVQRGKWDAAAQTLAALAMEPTRNSVTTEPWRIWLERLVDFIRAPTEASQAALIDFLRGFSWPVRVFRLTIETLVLAERLDAAHEVIGIAQRSFPQDKWLQTQKEAIAAQLASRTLAVPAEAAAPARAIPERIFVQRLEALIKAAQWDEAERYVQEVRAARPVPIWLENRDGMIRLAQVRIDYARHNLPGMLAASRVYLNGDVARSQEMLGLARGYVADGERDFGVGLAREIVRRTPEFVAAQRQLAEWGVTASEEKNASAPKTSAKSKTPEAKMPKGKVSATPSDDPAAQLAELRKRQRDQDLPGVTALARLYLNGDRDRSQKILEMAREFFSAGDTSAANALTTEVLRRTPNFPPAQRLLKEWEEAERK